MPPSVNPLPTSVKANPTVSAPVKPTTLPPGNHSGFSKLNSQPGVFRCKLRPDTNKRAPEHSDYSGTLLLANGERAMVRIWVHADGSLGLRLGLLPKPNTSCG